MDLRLGLPIANRICGREGICTSMIGIQMVHITEMVIVLCNANWHATECPDSRLDISGVWASSTFQLLSIQGLQEVSMQYYEVHVRISGSPYFEVPL